MKDKCSHHHFDRSSSQVVTANDPLYIREWLGYPPPKQYRAFVGKGSMLQHILDREVGE